MMPTPWDLSVNLKDVVLDFTWLSILLTDPEFETPVAEDLVYGSAVALLIGFPLLIVLNLPMNIFNNTLGGYWITLGILMAYFVLMLVLWRLLKAIRFQAEKPEHLGS